MFTITLSGKACKDVKKLNDGTLAKKGQKIFAMLQTNPFTLPEMEKMHYADNTFAVKLNIQHRLVYTVDVPNHSVDVVSAWSHYGGKFKRAE
ncbi:hypothetical protein [Lacticaseibacillus sharpeae]|uniref:Uncharacterized protein n=1 Tax=Lacticaseibacillus sharpeae JCM 1186 = DSM 20505 TaxID=1291052 RepID=A0A0R1ZJA8_9LACO|nr:hypothetical protein [Lacticaseibacillus sharpeae]KRM55048.1 hypothetical protein FC18_GL001756 [Lacticaseibacillus sharpeae JCM 1186 = DSM 20505]